MKVRAAVYMTFEVEVHVGCWEAAQSFEQLHNQATREAKNILSNKLLSSEIKLNPDKIGVMKVVTKQDT